MSISAKINKAVLEHGTTRDALNVTMTRLEFLKKLCYGALVTPAVVGVIGTINYSRAEMSWIDMAEEKILKDWESKRHGDWCDLYKCNDLPMNTKLLNQIKTAKK
jgi:hypothetical protein